tara:strand:- start:12215 stop:12472 length:258 start_codon:yes stop_codon:yes gene_type:complete
MDKLILIKNLNLPDDINHKIKLLYKYDLLETKYKKQKQTLNKHIQYYFFLNKKINKKDNVKQSILKTIKEFDYYIPHYYKPTQNI